MDYAIDRWKEILSSIRDMLYNDEFNNNEKIAKRCHVQQLKSNQRQDKEGCNDNNTTEILSYDQNNNKSSSNHDDILQKVVSSSSIVEVDMVYCDVRKPIEDQTIFHNMYYNNNNKGHTNGENNASQNILSQNSDNIDELHSSNIKCNTTKDIILGETATTEYNDDTEIRNDEHLNHNNSNQHVSIEERKHTIISNRYVDEMLCNTTNDVCYSSETIDLVIISYLFSETRNQWQIFMDGFVRNILLRQQQHLQYNEDCATTNNRYKTPMILVTDPTAWQ